MLSCLLLLSALLVHPLDCGAANRAAWCAVIRQQSLLQPTTTRSGRSVTLGRAMPLLWLRLCLLLLHLPLRADLLCHSLALLLLQLSPWKSCS